MDTPNSDSRIAAPSGSTTSSIAAFRKFDAYPWARDRPFLQGLIAMLGPITASTDRQKALGITLQARIWWYKSRMDVAIDRSAYERYIEQDASTCPDPMLLTKSDEIQRRMGATTPRPLPELPSWQLDAPKVDPSKKASDHRVQETGGGGAPYPESFQAIIEAVTTGKSVPGVREIPNTVVRQPGISPVGKMQAPQKPWEKRSGGPNVTTTAISSPSETGSGVVLSEFPPVDNHHDDENDNEATR
ncbi:hypothetical protein B0T17DRAFT_8657 [Bombardia bombarda]|uniref:Uncharacterized protein n=1 Tax=Bombardia bombarda TaxID=252184 RepID=A0AA39XIY4_9PEZI|nr:hypothetical protein B0T17DRAFT_8657 [Bombardia bombarda]